MRTAVNGSWISVFGQNNIEIQGDLRDVEECKFAKIGDCLNRYVREKEDSRMFTYAPRIDHCEY